MHTAYVSIRHGLLALLSQGPRYGYQLRAEFEASTGATWPLNIGQVYSTLSRLERDGLVTKGEADAEGRFVYNITPTGEEEVRRWFTTPVARADRPRDELAIKLAMAVTTPGVDVRDVVQAQRTATLRTLRDLTRLKADAPAVPAGPAESAWRLVLESMIFQAEAEVRWLDHCEAFMTRIDVGFRPAVRVADEPPAPEPSAPAPGRTGERR